jgi:hypothetical protein
MWRQLRGESRQAMREATGGVESGDEFLARGFWRA